MDTAHEYTKETNMSNKLFDTIRFLCEVLVPAIGTLYFALAKIWGLPYGTEIVGTCSAIAVFLGAIIGISRASYNSEYEEQTEFNDEISEVE